MRLFIHTFVENLKNIFYYLMLKKIQHFLGHSVNDWFTKMLQLLQNPIVVNAFCEKIFCVVDTGTDVSVGKNYMFIFVEEYQR